MSDSPFPEDYWNATLTFNTVGSAELAVDPKTGNPRPATVETIAIRAVLETQKASSVTQTPGLATVSYEPGVNRSEQILEGYLADPMFWPGNVDFLTPAFLEIRTVTGRTFTGKFFVMPGVPDPWGAEAYTGDRIVGKFWSN